ncbi:hypothetical protein PF008_g16416 [Phytophthora fragariae]|uniref:Uncharacterized protein n=1 Tax=Phytophthora fragariae TaxID=53985 RepID=A0A6G0RC37_9STRA|nr:hypothetical protein PF008_g16416 [Phytophthora fragariae]
MPHDSEDDLNAIEEGDNPDDFGGFESGDGVEEDGIVDDEEDEDGEGATAIELDEGDDEDDTEANDPNSAESIAERHFAEKFLNSLGKSDKLMAALSISPPSISLRIVIPTNTSAMRAPVRRHLLRHGHTASNASAGARHQPRRFGIRYDRYSSNS